jgi:WD40 repeat protein
VQRWGEFVGEVLVAEVPQQIVIFVDEIDSVLGLPFRADDFFAAIRECYNRRVDDGRYGRLTFALFGVCSPSDLIQDKRRTPFNVGEAIELTGFSYEEAIGLAKGLPGGEATLRSVLAWTGGQPFLTQRVCRLVAEMGTERVDEVVADRIISVWESQDEQVHFRTIQDRMLADESVALALLARYQQILMGAGGDLLDGTAEQLALRLTGVVVKARDRLVVANRIYRMVFDPWWVAAKLGALRPYGEDLEQWLEKRSEDWLLRGDELRKAQRWMGQEGLKLAPEDYQFMQESERLAARVELQAEQAARNTVEMEKRTLETEKQKLEASNRKAGRRVGLGSVFLVASLLGLVGAALAWDIADIRILTMTANNDYAGAKLQDAFLKGMIAYQRFRPLIVGKKLNLEHYQLTEKLMTTMLRTLMDSDIQRVGNMVDTSLKERKTAHESVVNCVAWSPDGQAIASGSADSRIKIWRRDGTLITTINNQSIVESVKWSPDGQIIASISNENSNIKLWRRDGTLITIINNISVAKSVAWSPDGKAIVSGSEDNSIKLWHRDGNLIKTIKSESGVNSVAWSPDGQTIASGSNDESIKLWSKNGGLIISINAGIVKTVVWSPDGQTIASIGDNNDIKLWRRDGTLITTINNKSVVISVEWSPDGKAIVSGSEDNSIKLWRRDGSLINTINNESAVSSVAWSPGGQTIVSASNDNSIKLWRKNSSLTATLANNEGSVMSIAWSPDGQTFVSGGRDNNVKRWNKDGTLIVRIQVQQGVEELRG